MDGCCLVLITVLGLTADVETALPRRDMCLLLSSRSNDEWCRWCSAVRVVGNYRFICEMRRAGKTNRFWAAAEELHECLVQCDSMDDLVRRRLAAACALRILYFQLD